MSNKPKYKHLNTETNEIMEMSLQEKIKWARNKHFIYYPKARQCIERLGWIYEQTIYDSNEFPSDLEGLSIIGYSGAGKTSIYQEFLKQHSSKSYPSYEGIPVSYCLLKDSITGLKGLYSALLTPYGHPFADPEAMKIQRITIDQLEEVLIYTLKQSGTKLVFIDEFQHVRGRNQQAILNQLKRTMLVSRVPFVPVGTPDAKKVLDLDPQLADRCPIKTYSILDYWSYSIEFRKFLKGYEEYLPFPEPSNLSAKDLSFMIFKKVQFQDGSDKGKTNLRHIARFLMTMANAALLQKLPNISEEIIDKITF